MRNKEINRLVETASELGAARLAETLGLHAGEVSQRQARKVYGNYFDLLCKQGRISPSHTEAGRAGTKFYRIADILTCKIEDRTPAELIVNP